ncbi:unnamed protein product, partial [Brenthis ino]
MGMCQTKYPGLTQDILEDYAALTFLSKGEIMQFHKDDIIEKFDVLKNSPFQDRLFRVFSSQKDDCFSFEDLLDLCSVMSPECLPEVKASWAFKVYDIDEDNAISTQDICDILDRLTSDPDNSEDHLDKESKMEIAKGIMDKMNLDNSGSISVSEFKMVLSRIPEFSSSFYFKL